jgi:hypothetical protein
MTRELKLMFDDGDSDSKTQTRLLGPIVGSGKIYLWGEYEVRRSVL